MLTKLYIPTVAIASFLVNALSANAVPFSFTPGAINDAPDLVTVGVTDFIINVSGLDVVTTSVTLTLFLNHDELSDLEIYLLNPTGERLLLAAGVLGASGINGAILQDGAFPAIETGGTTYTGNFTPTDSILAFSATPTITNFAGFNSLDPNGNWTLQVVDITPTNTGTLLTGTKLDIEAEPVPFEFSPVMGLGLLASYGLLRNLKKSRPKCS